MMRRRTVLDAMTAAAVIPMADSIPAAAADLYASNSDLYRNRVEGVDFGRSARHHEAGSIDLRMLNDTEGYSGRVVADVTGGGSEAGLFYCSWFEPDGTEVSLRSSATRRWSHPILDAVFMVNRPRSARN
jgi:hypothetical protein